MKRSQSERLTSNLSILLEIHMNEATQTFGKVDRPE
jgi:hypothetical protein